MSYTIVQFPKEYNPKETTEAMLENCLVTKTLEHDLGMCPLGKVSDALQLIAADLSLRLNRPHDFNVARKRLIKSVINN